jgi:IS5 family transposase
MNDELKPCPFCGSSDVKEYTDKSIHCRQCGAESGVDWNTRPLEDSLRAQLAEKDAELDAADAALTHIVDCMKNPNNRGSKTLLQTCRFFDDLINTATKIRARIV